VLTDCQYLEILWARLTNHPHLSPGGRFLHIDIPLYRVVQCANRIYEPAAGGHIFAEILRRPVGHVREDYGEK
jgi:hypothetical protein